MYCTHCGHQNAPGNKFCESCGQLMAMTPVTTTSAVTPIRESGISFRSLGIASATAGIVMALLSTIPVVSLGNYLACMWLWGSGIFGIWLYRRFEGSSSMTAGQGAIIGALSGLLGGIGSMILDPILVMLGMSIGNMLAIYNVFIFPVIGAIGGVIGAIVFGKAPRPF